uniref:Encoded peptide n=1 Tax=Phaseolus vulgaris TaxID=3885 RepID=V7CCL6_PHAVU|nr:hypothetical protein PHAVU_003G245600g [Phaseolus vulgaris]ESW27937.1 hypothetical protein PHAVU_003G245600g [Phaseolus vulgaris]
MKDITCCGRPNLKTFFRFHFLQFWTLAYKYEPRWRNIFSIDHLSSLFQQHSSISFLILLYQDIIMENTRLRNIAFVLFLFFILSHQSLFVHGRHLRSPLCEECSKHQNNSMSGHGISDHEVHQEGSRRVEYEVDDFRPTTPGHSPGVGHSINN